MSIPAAFAIVCAALVLLTLSIMAIRAQIDQHWWRRYAKTVGGENAARLIVQERERSDREIDAMIARGMKHMDDLERARNTDLIIGPDSNHSHGIISGINVLPFPPIVNRVSRGRPMNVTPDGDAA